MSTNEQEYERPGWLKGWYAVDGLLQKLERGLLVVGIFTILLVGTAHILARNFLGQGLPFSDVLAQHLTVWLGLLGATLAAASSEHISIDAFSRVLQGRRLQINKLVIGLVSTLLCGILTYRTIVFILFYTQSKTVEVVHLGTWKIPIWNFLYIFPYTFGLITLRYLMQTIDYALTPASAFVRESADTADETSEQGQPESEVEPVAETAAESSFTTAAKDVLDTEQADRPDVPVVSPESAKDKGGES